MRFPIEHLLRQGIKAPPTKSLNGVGLLNLVREHGPISRAALANLAHLSKPTVSSIMDELIRRELVVEEGLGKSGVTGGKRPTLVRFNKRNGYLIAVELGGTEIRLALTDLEGTILDEHRITSQLDGGPKHVLDRVHRGIRELSGSEGAVRARLRVVSIAASGPIDVHSGVIHDTGNIFNWDCVPVRDILEPVLGVPVWIDNNVNMAALGELDHGVARGEQDFVLIRLDTGIGCGVVVGGKLYYGSHWAAGEIAHLIFNTADAARDWGLRGYLEVNVAEDRVAERARAAAAGSPGITALARDLGDGPALIAAGLAGDPAAATVVESITAHLALGVGTIAATYDPSLIVLQGRLFVPLLEHIRRVVNRMLPWGARISLSSLGDDAVLLGTIAAARAQAFERIVRALDR
jgi:glucokinase